MNPKKDDYPFFCVPDEDEKRIIAEDERLVNKQFRYHFLIGSILFLIMAYLFERIDGLKAMSLGLVMGGVFHLALRIGVNIFFSDGKDKARAIWFVLLRFGLLMGFIYVMISANLAASWLMFLGFLLPVWIFVIQGIWLALVGIIWRNNGS